MTLIKEPTPENILLAAKNLKDGALIGLPTETVYGLAADAENKDAVRRIYEVKGRPINHPLIVHIGSIGYLEKWVNEIPDYALLLAEKFWPGPISLILKRSAIAQDFVTGSQESVAIRIPQNEIALSVLNEFHKIGGKGLAAPSANKFGAVSPTSASAVNSEIGGDLDFNLDLILDGNECDIGLESTIINCLDLEPSIMRHGAITISDIQNTLGKEISQKKINKSLRHPGIMEKHYSPKAKIVTKGKPKVGDGFIALSGVETPFGCHRIANPTNVNEYAKILYSAFRKGDLMNLSRIFVVKPTGEGLAMAINERVNKAAI